MYSEWDMLMRDLEYDFREAELSIKNGGLIAKYKSQTWDSCGYLNKNTADKLRIWLNVVERECWNKEQLK